MTPANATKLHITQALEQLPPESLATVADFVEFLRAKAQLPTHTIVRLGGLWQGYEFSEHELRTARQEAWATLGQDFDA